MFGIREYIRTIHFDAIIVSAIVIFGILTFNNSTRSITIHTTRPVSTYITLIEKWAVSSPYIRIQVFQRTWILNKDNFNLLAYNYNPLSESKKTGIKVSHLKSLRESSHRIPQFLLRYHLFPPETGEPPSLS
jgi:hypothetical protein